MTVLYLFYTPFPKKEKARNKHAPAYASYPKSYISVAIASNRTEPLLSQVIILRLTRCTVTSYSTHAIGSETTSDWLLCRLRVPGVWFSPEIREWQYAERLF